MNRDERIRRLEQQDNPDGPNILHAVVTPDGKLVIHDKPAMQCESAYHRAVIGVDGVPRILLPAGRVQEVKPCTKCAA